MADQPSADQADMSDFTHDPMVGRTGLIARYIGQIIHGCGDARCTQVLCRTGHRNTTTRPYRDFNSRSARAFAVALCLEPDPDSRTCQYYRLPASGLDSVLSRRDNSSYIQQLMDTPSMLQIGSSSGTFIPQHMANLASSAMPRLDYAVSTNSASPGSPRASQHEPSQATTTHYEHPQAAISFNPARDAEKFRMANYAKMRKAYYDAIVTRMLWDKTQLYDIQPIFDTRLVQPYLVLSVTRENLLKDTFDQLWQRQRYELVRPLRIRLHEPNGTVHGEDIGQDLGGVQIECFNLICKTLFAKDSPMFVTECFSYFRPGSLQPLYMFELCGLLFALAMYNGVQLPVDLDRVLYMQLRQPPESLPQDDPHILDWLRMGWPTEFNSLNDVREKSLEEVGVEEFSFPFEANGLLLQARPPRTPTRTGNRMDLEVTQAINLGSLSKPVDITAIADDWPGWHLIPTTEVEPVTEANKEQFIRQYASWVMYDRVAPQREAFFRGFSHLIDQKLLRDCFKTAGDLQHHVEGLRSVDIDSLMQVTTYAGMIPDLDNSYIRSFWNMVRGWDEEKQRRLLKFVTSRERFLPGMSLQLHIDGEEDEGNLPTSSTCFSILYLPNCPLPILEKRLTLALDLGMEGFGNA